MENGNNQRYLANDGISDKVSVTQDLEDNVKEDGNPDLQGYMAQDNNTDLQSYMAHHTGYPDQKTEDIQVQSLDIQDEKDTRSEQDTRPEEDIRSGKDITVHQMDIRNDNQALKEKQSKFVFEPRPEIHRIITSFGSVHKMADCSSKFYCYYRVLGRRHKKWTIDVLVDKNFVTRYGTFNALATGPLRDRLIPVTNCVKLLCVSETKCYVSVSKSLFEDSALDDDSWVTARRRCGIKNINVGINVMCICDRVFKSHHIKFTVADSAKQSYISFEPDFVYEKVLLILITLDKIPKLMTMAQLQQLKMDMLTDNTADLRDMDEFLTPHGQLKTLASLSPWQKKLLLFNTTGETQENNFACQAILGAAGGHSDFVTWNSSDDIIDSEFFMDEICDRMHNAIIDWNVEKEISKKLFQKGEQLREHTCRQCCRQATDTALSLIDRNLELWSRLNGQANGNN